jgi:hypothetical protein
MAGAELRRLLEEVSQRTAMDGEEIELLGDGVGVERHTSVFQTGSTMEVRQ